MTKSIKIKIISGIMIAIIVLAFLFVVVDDDTSIGDYDYDESLPYTDTSEWMKYLSDQEYISEISIPGTHDSATENVPLGYIMRCQNTSISTQLDNGYRYLDFRLAVDDENGDAKLKFVHNFVNCHVSGNIFSDYLYLDDVANDIYDFLDQHPQETVIVNVKIEDEDHEVSQVQKLLFDEVGAHPDYWYTDSEIPTLGQVRGKIVLMTRFEDEAGLGGNGIQFIWEEQDNTTPVDIPYELYVNNECRLWVQDRYKYSFEDKFEALEDGFENCEADENTFFLNFASTTGTGVAGHPKTYADKINSMLMDYEFKENVSYGIIVVDYGTADLARHIYLSNEF